MTLSPSPAHFSPDAISGGIVEGANSFESKFHFSCVVGCWPIFFSLEATDVATAGASF